MARLPVASPATMAASPATAAASPEARPSPGGKTPYIPAVIKTTKRAGACSWLSVKRRMSTSVVSIAVVEIAMVKVAAIEVVAAEIVAIDYRPAVGGVGVVVVDH